MSIKLKSLITEDWRSKEIPYEEYDKLRNSGNFSAAYTKVKEGFRIYRGGDYGYGNYIVDPSKYRRASANTSNFYTGLIDGLPSWENWPKRSQSLVCSNSLDYASGYGRVANVYPKNGSKIGVCSARDFWLSFSVIEKRLEIGTMSYFNDTMSDFFAFAQRVLTEWGTSIPEDLSILVEGLDHSTYKDFMGIIDEYVKPKLFPKLAEISYKEGLYHLSNVISDLRDNFSGKWEKYFDDLLNPDDNGFRLQTIENYQVNMSEKHEVWTDGISLLDIY